MLVFPIIFQSFRVLNSLNNNLGLLNMKNNKKSFILHFPLIGKNIKRIDKETSTMGISYALKNAINHSKSKINLFVASKKVMKILTKSPTIVLSNHYSFFDSIIIGSVLPFRKNIFFIANSFYLGLGKNIDRHILPIHMSHYWTKTSNYLSNCLMKIVYFFSRQKQNTFSKNHDLNRKTIDKAVSLLLKNALILLLPEDLIKKHWFKGIGHLIKKTNALASKKTIYIVFIKIEGISGWDILRIFPYVGKLLPKITVSITHCSSISKLKKYSNANTITSLLEKKYNYIFSKNSIK